MATFDELDVTLQVVSHDEYLNLSLYIESNGVKLILAHQKVELDVEDDGTIMIDSVFEMLSNHQVWIEYMTKDEYMQRVWGKDSEQYKIWKSKNGGE